MVEDPGVTDDEEEIPTELGGPSAETVEEQEERAEYLATNKGQLKRAWRDTIEDMEAIGEEWRAEGFDVTELVSVDAGPIGRDSNDDEGEFGMEFVIADDDVDEFVAALEAGEYPQYDVYRGEVQADAFIVEELVDEDAERVILLAGAYKLKDTTMCAFAAREEGEMYTFVRTLDGTRHGAFKHDGYEKFFPRADDLPEDPMDIEMV